MAKFSCDLYGDFDEILRAVDQEVSSSISATLEGETWFGSGRNRCVVRVYERYSVFGGNRLSLTFALYQSEGRITCSAITAGGSQAVFFKINTIGEENFLAKIEKVLKPFVRNTFPNE